MLSTVLLIVLVLLIVGALPRWPHSKDWGNGPWGFLSILLIVMLVLMLVGAL